MQLILCQTQSLPLHIIAEVFEALLIIINSATKIVSDFTGKNTLFYPLALEKAEIGE